ncbi:3-dehydroquinate synthase II [Aetokthonos hydrillicola Thurmond2011]|jgi:3-amino-4-hydroxybenzoic acid synthase|uniref:3-dehydroquinate synthase II n=1 Tax=Aetokthonos hydrillicola Thurmond2011 TaxID=2712845 RepID=A0AAP5I9Y0_9CYAN|nr:3-dehydroquinate synthase II family protein [Aetokthonos hydrillicola]MBO3460029.1 3-dehydroquinate synthase II family protein [Aetokthonos hydrillicola CCALA 1050]MBW4584626.1 3-dehydroquinate synthase II [Aetokthonos hydrillicola CCALA 1050]MDR9895170.1 3-dehydroquinate synthase II [Aetokthonos hydrillicola Thurmond2011]
MKLAWLDIKNTKESAVKILSQPNISTLDGIVVDSPESIKNLPPNVDSSVKRIAFVKDKDHIEQFVSLVDIVILDACWAHEIRELKEKYQPIEIGVFVDVVDEPTLQIACESAKNQNWTVIYFKDPTKIPLEIVIAAAENANGKIITIAKDIEEAEIILGVLEKGSHGVMLAPRSLTDAVELATICHQIKKIQIPLEELEVTKITHIGMGERACIDTCSYFEKDEGILIGSFSKGMILVASETHPLPYMPTRPFRVNAGAIHSYAVSNITRTNYLSELNVGHKILAVDCQGKSREIVIGRVKIEIRPLLSINAVSTTGETVNLIVQDDWHVRVLGPNNKVLNVTELTPGELLLGYLASSGRHVGFPVQEYCLEK